MSKKIPPKRCPRCGINMRAAYIQQSVLRDGKKRRSQWIRIGQVCLSCEQFIRELKEAEE